MDNSTLPSATASMTPGNYTATVNGTSATYTSVNNQGNKMGMSTVILGAMIMMGMLK